MDDLIFLFVAGPSSEPGLDLSVVRFSVFDCRIPSPLYFLRVVKVLSAYKFLPSLVDPMP